MVTIVPLKFRGRCITTGLYSCSVRRYKLVWRARLLRRLPPLVPTAQVQEVRIHGESLCVRTALCQCNLLYCNMRICFEGAAASSAEWSVCDCAGARDPSPALAQAANWTFTFATIVTIGK